MSAGLEYVEHYLQLYLCVSYCIPLVRLETNAGIILVEEIQFNTIVLSHRIYTYLHSFVDNMSYHSFAPIRAVQS